MSQQDAIDALEMIQDAYDEGRASTVSLTRPGTLGEYDTETGTVKGAKDPETFTTAGVKIGYEQRDIDGTMVRTGDQQVYVPAKGFTRPLSDEVLTIGTETYTVVNTEVIAPGDVDILYIIQVRGLS